MVFEIQLVHFWHFPTNVHFPLYWSLHRKVLSLFTIPQNFPCCSCLPGLLQRLGSGNVSGECCSACWIDPAHLFPGLPALHCSPTCCPSLSCCLCGQAHNGSLGCGFQPLRDRDLQAVWMKHHPKSGVSRWWQVAYPTLMTNMLYLTLRMEERVPYKLFVFYSY